MIAAFERTAAEHKSFDFRPLRRAPAEEVFSCPDEADLPSSFSLRTDANSARVPPSTISMC